MSAIGLHRRQSEGVVDAGITSPIGRLLRELSWEGNARHYRDGGRGRENVLMVEVFSLLDLLPRSAFLGEVLRRAHGGIQEVQAVADVEEMSFRLLPGDVPAVDGDRRQSAWAVQPDARLESDRVAMWVEAKRMRRSSFQRHQIGRTLAALLSNANGRSPVLLLVLGEPPPVQVQGLGRISLQESVEHSLPHLGPTVDAQAVRDAASAISWTTWSEIGSAVTDATDGYRNHDPSTTAAVMRMADSLLGAIAWHG